MIHTTILCASTLLGGLILGDFEGDDPKAKEKTALDVLKKLGIEESTIADIISGKAKAAEVMAQVG